MDAQKLKKGSMCYLVLHKRDWSHKPAVIVSVKVMKRTKRLGLDWVVVEQLIDGYKHRLTVHVDWLAPHRIPCAKNLLHNMKMWEKRWSANCWRHKLNHKTAKSEVEQAISELPKYKQNDILKQVKKVYPNLLKPDNSFKVSKMNMKHWDELAWASIALKYPLKNVWDYTELSPR